MLTLLLMLLVLLYLQNGPHRVLDAELSARSKETRKKLAIIAFSSPIYIKTLMEYLSTSTVPSEFLSSLDHTFHKKVHCYQSNLKSPCSIHSPLQQ
jgi:hypothetical protein